jgi:hypothetical protein
LPPKVAAWAAQGRTQNEHGSVSDNSAVWQRVLRVDSVKPGLAALLAEDAQLNWSGDIVCAVLEAQDGNISGISRGDARKFFPEGWQYPTLTPEEKAVLAAAEIARKAEVDQRFADYTAAPKITEVNQPHTKFDENSGSGVW